MTSKEMPAWSEPFQTDRRGDLRRDERVIAGAEPRDWLAGRGEGVTVAIINSGVDGGHPAVGGKLIRSLRVDLTLEEPAVVDDEEARDVVGHGTACAGIIHGLAPEADIISIRVLNPDNKGKGLAFAHALDWVVENRVGIANMSLSSKSEALYATFHDLVDQAYFANSLLVCSASNYPGEESYPSVFSSVFSVAAHDIPEPLTWFYNPTRRSSSGHGALTSRSPGPRADRSWRPATASPRHTSRACWRDSARSTRPRPHSRRRHCWHAQPRTRRRADLGREENRRSKPRGEDGAETEPAPEAKAEPRTEASAPQGA